MLQEPAPLLQQFELHITVTSDNGTAIPELSSHCSLTIGAIKQAIIKGALWLTRGTQTQRLRRIKKKLQAQDILHFYYNENILNEQPPTAKLIADLKEYSVWYKPYRMLSQGSKWSDHCSISRWAQSHLIPERPVFIVHRLDKAATGIILLAHTKKAVRALTGMFEKRYCEHVGEKDSNLVKRYQIIVHGNHTQHCQPEVITENIDGKVALSTFTLNDYNAENDLSLIDVKIDSGRKHQIRLHAASINLPIVGDRLHGDTSRKYPAALNLQLCAVSLSFICPLSGQALEFKVPEELRPHIDQVITLLT